MNIHFKILRFPGTLLNKSVLFNNRLDDSVQRIQKHSYPQHEWSEASITKKQCPCFVYLEGTIKKMRFSMYTCPRTVSWDIAGTLRAKNSALHTRTCRAFETPPRPQPASTCRDHMSCYFANALVVGITNNYLGLRKGFKIFIFTY